MPFELTRRSWEAEADYAKIAQTSFLEEELVSNLSYPPQRKVLPPNDQAEKLRSLFPELSRKNTIQVSSLPERAEGWLVVPQYTSVAGNHHKALERALDLLNGERRSFLNCRRGELGPDCLRTTQRTQRFLERFEARSQDGLYVLPVQLGSRHLGKSARQAHVAFRDDEFGLGPYDVTIFLITHPEWLSTPDDLGIDSIGCEYGPYGHGLFKYILFFYFCESLKFEERYCGCPDVRFGPATGFHV